MTVIPFIFLSFSEFSKVNFPYGPSQLSSIRQDGCCFARFLVYGENIVRVLYYSRTGNTQEMAEAVMEGSQSRSDVEVELKCYALLEELADFDAVRVGVPTYHHDMTIDITKLFEEVAVRNVNLKGKIGATFGSYGWSGEAPHLVLEIMKNRYGMDAIESPLLIKYSPAESELERCRQFGKEIAERLMA